MTNRFTHPTWPAATRDRYLRTSRTPAGTISAVTAPRSSGLNSSSNMRVPSRVFDNGIKEAASAIRRTGPLFPQPSWAQLRSSPVFRLTREECRVLETW